MNNTIEIWKNIKDFEELYQVSNLGNVKSLPRKGTTKTEKILIKQINKDGYYSVNLCKKGKHYRKFIHRLVAENFISNPNNYLEVNHKDGNKRKQ